MNSSEAFEAIYREALKGIEGDWEEKAEALKRIAEIAENAGSTKSVLIRGDLPPLV